MHISDLVAGLGWLLIFEGLPLFIAPDRYRQLLAQVGGVRDRTLRVSGFLGVSAGLVVLYALRG